MKGSQKRQRRKARKVARDPEKIRAASEKKGRPTPKRRDIEKAKALRAFLERLDITDAERHQAKKLLAELDVPEELKQPTKIAVRAGMNYAKYRQPPKDTRDLVERVLASDIQPPEEEGERIEEAPSGLWVPKKGLYVPKSGEVEEKAIKA